MPSKRDRSAGLMRGRGPALADCQMITVSEQLDVEASNRRPKPHPALNPACFSSSTIFRTQIEMRLSDSSEKSKATPTA